MRFTRTIALTAALAAWAPSVSLAQSDSVKASREPLFTARDAVIAVAFVGGMAAAFPLDRQLARSLRDSSMQAIRFAKNAAEALNWLGTPGTLVIGGVMYTSGRWIFRSRELADLGLHGTEALLIGTVTGAVLKGLFGRERPYVKRDPFSYKVGRGFGGHGAERSPVELTTPPRSPIGRAYRADLVVAS